MNNNYTQHQEAKFNAAASSAERIHLLLIDCNFFSRRIYSENFSERKHSVTYWKLTLDALYREISPKLSPNEIIRVGEYIEIFSKPTILFDPRKKIFNESNLDKYIKLLYDFELKLRKMADLHSLLIPDKKSGLDALDND